MVIAVIGILAALLLSATATAKLKAQQIKCVSNLRQLGLAHFMYLEDFQREFPSVEGWGMAYSWTILLNPYYGKNAAVQLCPSASRLPFLGHGGNLPGQFNNGLSGTADNAWSHVSSTSDWYQGNNVTNYGSYAFNGWLYRLSNPTTTAFFQVAGEIKTPYLTPLFADADSHDALVRSSDAPSPDLYYTGITQIGNMRSFTIARHWGRSASAAPRNVDTSKRLPGNIDMVLFDGHVEKVPLENLWNYYWNATWQVPKPRPN